MTSDVVVGQQHMLHEALSHLQSALDLLDRASAPAQVGAQIDLAIHQLEALIKAGTTERGAPH